MRIEILQEAEEELNESVGYYEETEPGLGLRLKEEIHSVILWIQNNPEVPRLRPERYRRVIAEEMDEARFAAGETVFKEGDPGDTVYVVHAGRASVRKGGKEIASVGPGGEFGEMAALSAAPRAATVVAAEELVCGALPGASFRELVRAEPDIALHLARLFAQRMADR